MRNKNEMEAQVQRVLGIKPPSDEKVNRLAELNLVAKNIADKLEASLKPKGYYNIPPLLDERRLEYGIPNGAFESYPAFDKVYIHQLPFNTQKTYASDGMILRPDQINAYDRNTAPRGILVAAGLQAMDAIYSTGIEIGHIVRFKKMSPFVMIVDTIDGHDLSIYVVRDGDIDASEDMAKHINSKHGKIENVSPEGKSYDFRYIKDGVTTGNKVSPYYDPSV